MSAFSDFFYNLFGYVSAKVKSFLAGPGGDILKGFVQNLVQVAGAEGAAILMQMAKNNVAGKPVLSDVEWSKVAADLQQQAIAQAINTTPALIDAVIGNAVASNKAATSQ